MWDAVLHTARHPEQGHNLVCHEFAHKLDMLDGVANGTPAIADRARLAEWVAVCSREFLRLRRLAETGAQTFLDAYGATNEAEFIAVATEEFFDRPIELRKQASGLYRVLSDYYRQGPSKRVKHACQKKEISLIK